MSDFPTMKDAVILQVIPGLSAGGAEKTTIEMAEAITTAGGRALVVSAGGRLEGELAKAGGEFIRKPNIGSKNPITMRANAKWLAKIARSENVSLFHARSRAPAWSAYWASKQAKLPFVTTYHGAYNGRSSFKRWYNSIMARGQKVIANSTFIAEHIGQTYPWSQDRIITVHRGVDQHVFSPEFVRQKRIKALEQYWFGDTGKPDGLLVLMPGRLTSWKGQEDAISAYFRLKERPGQMIIAGDDQGRTNYREKLLQQISDDKLEGIVRLVPHCTDMAAAYALADIVLAPSREPEAFGRVAAEAGAMGVPVVAARHGGQMEIVEDSVSGFLIQPGDPQDIADAIEKIVKLGPDGRQSMGVAARERVLARFSKIALQKATLDVYRQVLT